MRTSSSSNLLLVTNTIVNRNPALLRIAQDLHENFNLYIYGKEENFYLKSQKIHYKSTRNIVLFCKIIAKLAKPIGLIKNSYYLILIKKINIQLYNWILSKYIQKNFFNLAIYIDTEALGISQYLNIQNNWYFIYEIYHNQLINENQKIQKYNRLFEARFLKNTDVLISSANDFLGRYLVTNFDLKKAEILAYSICPPKAINFSEIKENYEKLKFYYHGALVPNRGLEEAIVAFKEIKNAELYIRGFGCLKNHLISLIDQLKLNDRVFILSPLPTEELTNAASYFDVGLTLVRMNIENHRYGVGFKTFENISAGLALVLPASYPLKEVNSKFQVGVNYEDATVEELKKVFQYLTSNIHIVNTFKKNARKAYYEYYNPETQKNILINKIHDCLVE